MQTKKMTAQQAEYVLVSIEAEDETDTEITAEPRAGALCPKCRQGNLDYDGLLNLSCPKCGHSVAGCFT
ncbi:MAG TPA: hypothetical protein VIK64_05660 [Anaerolineales bacterium]